MLDYLVACAGEDAEAETAADDGVGGVFYGEEAVAAF